ncbi:hypothetical protein [Streptomyces sp. NPDC050388]|uniref:hypothetical protein n=1 Tax=Streptomyces sp. NPDC050388 TaxID=3155781 RepID=UPI00341A5E6F
MPTTTVRMTLSEREGGIRMEPRSAFDSREQRDQLAERGAVEGVKQTIGQVDDLPVA